MKKSVLYLLSFLFVLTINAQDTTAVSTKKKKPVIDLSGRANDHLLIQLGSATWAGKPESIRTKGLSRTFNFYAMFDFPVKTNPVLSIGVGVGIGSEHIYFNKMYLGIKDLTSTLTIDDRSDSVYFERYKLATSWLEAPIELRYTKNPLKSSKSFKAAIGIKVGTLARGQTKGSDFKDLTGTVNPYTQKESSKRFFNKNRLSVTGRVGLGAFSIFGSYQVTQLFKEGLAPKINPWAIGLTLSGL
jgi:hypothetical protein